MRVAVNFSINEGLTSKIKKKAHEEDVSRSHVVNNILTEYFEERECFDDKKEKVNN